MCASHLLNRWLHGASNTGEQEMVQVSLEQIQPFSLNPRRSLSIPASPATLAMMY